MKYSNQIALARTGLTMLIAESVKNAGRHISTYYKSMGIPYHNVETEDLYNTPAPVITINQYSFSGAEPATLMHLSVKNDGLLRIIYNDKCGSDNNTIAEHVSVESLYVIAKWLQDEQLLLASRVAETCMHCGSFKIQKESLVDVNNKNAFVEYCDAVGTQGNWCPTCQHVQYGFVKYDQTDIPDIILNKWWEELPEEIKKIISGKQKDWQSMDTEIKRRIWCNYREI